MADEQFEGQACQRLTLPCGDTVLVALQGAQVLSWVSQGRERLYLSPNNLWDGKSAIRGGVPVCFPQFNQRGTLPKHGFARNMVWKVDDAAQGGEAVANGDAAHIAFTLSTNSDTLAIWQQAFVVELRVALTPGQLTLTLTVNNTEAKNASNSELHFTGALHTYLAVDDIDLTELRGLGGRPEWDAVADVHGLADEVLYFDGEFDRVYDSAAKPLHLQDGTSTLQIEQSPSWANSVVWNPGEAKCAALADMPAHGFARMLCVEAAQVFEPVSIPAAGQWVGWQRLTVS
jgi:glucose-6-phosphate 1-epimerase